MAGSLQQFGAAGHFDSFSRFVMIIISAADVDFVTDYTTRVLHSLVVKACYWPPFSRNCRVDLDSGDSFFIDLINFVIDKTSSKEQIVLKVSHGTICTIQNWFVKFRNSRLWAIDV